MFRTAISTTPLTNPTANSFFTNIFGDSFQGDTTFVATLRALVAPRLKENDAVCLNYRATDYRAVHISQTSDRRMIENICSYIDEYDLTDGMIYIHSFNASDQADNYACFELVKSSFNKVFSDWHRLDKVTEFFRKTFYSVCYIQPESKNVIIFVDNLDIRKMHYLQCSILAFMPWYFNPDEGVSELEMELIRSLREKSSAPYEDCIRRIAERYDFRTEKIRNLLRGFENRYERADCEATKNEISSRVRNIENLNAQIAEQLRMKHVLETKLLGLETKLAENTSDSELMEYFLCNRKLSLESVDDTKMTFIVMDRLSYFDEDMLKTLLDRETSYIYMPNGRSCNNIIPKEDMRMLLEAIFIDQKVYVRFCAAYRFDIMGSVRGLSGYHFGGEYREYMPNPHINQYHCMGNYERTINELLMNRNYIGALEQCIASCKSLNFGDSVVMAHFMSTLYGLNGSIPNCIELPDGRIVDPKSAIEWLKTNA